MRKLHSLLKREFIRGYIIGKGGTYTRESLFKEYDKYRRLNKGVGKDIKELLALLKK